MKINAWRQLFSKVKATQLSGRYITLDHIESLLKQFESLGQLSLIGKSVQDRPIYAFQIGGGKTRVLMWSQMHGNESTTTKALFDLLNAFKSTEASALLNNLKLTIIPMLNPDGAKAYTRNNANDIDLNRDAQALSQPESKALRDIFNKFNPHYCFNLHGQRTIYSAGPHPKSAILSFLAPAQDPDRNITPTRKKAMTVIARINEELQQIIPGHVALYNDGFNINCVGDTFQSLNSPSILFEAGHAPSDYLRETVREYMFLAIVAALQQITTQTDSDARFERYLEIPHNEERFYDIIIRNTASGDDIAIQYTEILNEGEIVFSPEIVKIGQLNNHYGHKEVDAAKKVVSDLNLKPLKVGYANDCVLINHELYSLK